jgi:hypothetical protein
LYVFKSGSSVLFVISSAVALPLSDFLYMSSFIGGQATQTFTIYDGFALFVLVFSLFIYYSEKEDRVISKDDAKRYVAQTPMFSAPSEERAHLRHQQYLEEHQVSLLA